MDPSTLESLKLELIDAYVRHCALLTRQARAEQTDSALVLHDLAWLSARCQKLCDSNDAQQLHKALRDARYWHECQEQAPHRHASGPQ